MACKMWKITALTWEISSGRLVEKFHIFAFPMYYSLHNWIGDHEITRLKKKVIFASNPEKKETKTSTKKHEWNGMTHNGLFFWYFLSEMRMRKHHLYNHRYDQYSPQRTVGKTGAQQGVWALKWVSFAGARALLLNLLNISTHLILPHGENI